MKHIFTFFFCFLLIAIPASSKDYKLEIGQKGDAAWEDLLKDPEDGKIIDPPLSAHVIAADFNQYKGNLMLFPEFCFE